MSSSHAAGKARHASRPPPDQPKKRAQRNALATIEICPRASLYPRSSTVRTGPARRNVSSAGAKETSRLARPMVHIHAAQTASPTLPPASAISATGADASSARGGRASSEARYARPRPAAIA